MSSLMDKPFKLQQDNQNYIFSVCSSAGNPCMENDGKFNLYFLFNLIKILYLVYFCAKEYINDLI